MNRLQTTLLSGLCGGFVLTALAGELPGTKLIPRTRVVPQPYDQVSFQRDEKEIARYHFSPTLNRPFVFPVVGPSGRSLTRMGHPGDPYSHSHHYSVWIGYAKVNGVDFWGDHRADRGRIVHQRLEWLDDGPEWAYTVSRAAWTTSTGKVLLQERRHTVVRLLPNDEWILVIDLKLEAEEGPVTFEQGQLGPIGVRVAKTIATHFGGGLIRNSEGGKGEGQVFRRRARWVDYSGPVAPGAIEGLALMDHPSNPNHPAPFHVREDGWMGALLTLDVPCVVSPGKPLELRYGVYVHAGLPAPETIDRQWSIFATAPLLPPVGPPVAATDCMHGDWQKYNTPQTFKSQADCLSFVKEKR